MTPTPTPYVTRADVAGDLPKPMTAEEAANMLGISVATLRRKANNGEIAYSQSGGIYWYWPHDVYAYLFRRRNSRVEPCRGR